jgi:hypothetical protein
VNRKALNFSFLLSWKWYWYHSHTPTFSPNSVFLLFVDCVQIIIKNIKKKLLHTHINQSFLTYTFSFWSSSFYKVALVVSDIIDSELVGEDLKALENSWLNFFCNRPMLDFCYAFTVYIYSLESLVYKSKRQRERGRERE